MNRIDHDALSRAVEIARKDPVERKRIDARLAKGRDWTDVATSAAVHCQMQSLRLMPWESPPMFGHIDKPCRDQQAAELLQRMLALRISCYERPSMPPSSARRGRDASPGRMPMPLALTDAELSMVMEAARPLRLRDRGDFLREVALKLECYPELGPGIVGRVCKEVQRRHFDPPQFNGRPPSDKYG